MLYSISKKNPELRSKLLKPFIADINPNTITAFALLAAIIAGAMFFYGHLLFGVLFVLLNGFLDILDGEIARVKKRTTKLGDFLDHTSDRLADVAIFLGIAMSPFANAVYSYILVVVILLVSYLGTEAETHTKKRNYGGFLGRSDRLILVVIFGIANLFFSSALYYGVMVILVLSIITFIQRFMNIYKELR